MGLRWWSTIDDEGLEKWSFESLDVKNNNKVDNKVFWVVCYGMPIVWALLAFVSVLKFAVANLIICVAVIALSFINLQGYIRCEKNHNQKIKGYLFKQAKEKMTIEQMAKAGQMAA